MSTRVDWDYYDKYTELIDKYMETVGEGNTKASQIVTSINKLIYKWYNDGDVFDNSYDLEGGANDLSDYANWLYENTTEKIKDILDKIQDCENDTDYEILLKELADNLLEENYLEEQNKFEKTGSIYKYIGKFKYVEDEEEYNYNDEYIFEDDEEEDW